MIHKLLYFLNHRPDAKFHRAAHAPAKDKSMSKDAQPSRLARSPWSQLCWWNFSNGSQIYWQAVMPPAPSACPEIPWYPTSKTTDCQGKTHRRACSALRARARSLISMLLIELQQGQSKTWMGFLKETERCSGILKGSTRFEVLSVPYPRFYHHFLLW